MTAAIPMPQGVADITSEWLTAALGSTGAANGTIASLDVAAIGVGVGIVGELFRLTPRWEDGTGPATIIAKVPSTLPSARFVAGVLSMYRREVRFYEQLSADAAISHAQLYYAALDDNTQDFVLLLSDLAGGRSVDQLVGCTHAEAELAVDRLASLHAGFWSSAALEATDWLPRMCDSPLPEAVSYSFEQSWPVLLDMFGNRVPDDVRKVGDRFPSLIPVMMQRLSEPPFTLSHGDYRLDNMFFAPDTADLSVCDWQLVDRSRGGRDLGYFITQSLTAKMRSELERPLVERYVAGLESRGVSDYSFDTAWDDYRLSALFGLCYPVIAGGGIEHADVRATTLTGDMLDRCIAAIEELDCLDLADP